MIIQDSQEVIKTKPKTNQYNLNTMKDQVKTITLNLVTVDKLLKISNHLMQCLKTKKIFGMMSNKIEIYSMIVKVVVEEVIEIINIKIILQIPCHDYRIININNNQENLINKINITHKEKKDKDIITQVIIKASIIQVNKAVKYQNKI